MDSLTEYRWRLLEETSVDPRRGISARPEYRQLPPKAQRLGSQKPNQTFTSSFNTAYSRDMDRLFLPALILFAAAATAVVSPSRAFACTCAESSVAERVSAADLVFEGRVTAVSNAIATVHVTQSWKGDVPQDLQLALAPPSLTAPPGLTLSNSCEVNVTIDEVYIVFATREGETMHTSLCSTMKAGEHRPLLDELGLGVTPFDPTPYALSASEGAPGELPPGTRAGCASCATTGRLRTGLPALWLCTLGLALGTRRAHRWAQRCLTP